MKPVVTRTEEVWEVSRLVPYAKNVKKHDDAQVNKIIESIQLGGWTSPIIVEPSGSIIAGHGRRLAAIKLGRPTVPVVVIAGLTPEQVRALRLADNRAGQGDIDTLMFRDEILGLEGLLTGIFDVKELEFSLADLGDLNDAAFVPDVAAAVETQESVAHAKADEVGARRVPLSKVFGFKDVAGVDEIHIVRFMAKACSVTGLTGAAALAAFLQTIE
jgi:ParB-like chromosome segregation protein Spo0J